MTVHRPPARSMVIQMVSPRSGSGVTRPLSWNEHSEGGSVPFPHRCPESTATGCGCFRDDAPRGFGRVAVAVDTSRELVGDLRLLHAGLTDDESAVPDEVRAREPFDREQAQAPLGVVRVLSHPFPQVIDGWPSLGVDQAQRPAISLGPELPMRFGVGRTPRPQVKPIGEQLGGHRPEGGHGEGKATSAPPHVGTSMLRAPVSGPRAMGRRRWAISIKVAPPSRA